MGKAPAFQFYVKDWLSDPQLRMASAATRGIWIDILCFMWEAPIKGKLSGRITHFARLLRATEAEIEEFINEAVTLKFADVTNSHGEVTIINRRMYRDYLVKEDAKLRKRKQRERERSHEEVTSLSSSSSSSSSSKDIKEPPLTPPGGEPVFPPENGKVKKRRPEDHDPEGFEAFYRAYPKKRKRKEAQKAWNRLKPDSDLRALIITEVEARAREDPEWLKDKGQFIPLPASYLNGEMWTDVWRTQPGRAEKLGVSDKTVRNIRNLAEWIQEGENAGP